MTASYKEERQEKAKRIIINSMKRMWRRLPILVLFSMSLFSCSKEEKEIGRDEALAILKQIDRQINYTPLTNPPKSYILNEFLSTYTDDEKELKDVSINREIDQNNHYSFVRIKGKYLDNDYIHENWTYISNDKNVTCHYFSYIDKMIFNDRYRYETEKDVEGWGNVAKDDISEMQRLYARMAMNFYSDLYSNEIISGKYVSSSAGSLDATFESESYRYSCTFSDYRFVYGAKYQKENGNRYSASVLWDKCDISMPNLDFYPLRENKESATDGN